ncbi:unnamed protein product [Rangifer tarandus platyrhynchus]|uniref:Uncharacterized protein n=2 Tax=Rangifer tarandus platyrhynchus TaxID=3082113 RepID=A0AC59Y6R9_RANTA|nr:unnamed protein product [Rangifer tarandus platyrhynchus]
MQPDAVSWVPQEWPGPAWKLRAWISGNRGPSPWEGGEILALSPKELYPPPPQPAAPAASLSLDRPGVGREAEALLRRRAAFRMCLGASGEIQALGSLCLWQLDVFLVSSMSFLTFPCVHC